MDSQPPLKASRLRSSLLWLEIMIRWLSGSLELALQREPNNPVDQLAGLVVKRRRIIIVGHVPFNPQLARIFFHFLKRSFNKGTAEITGDKVNCGRRYPLYIAFLAMLSNPDQSKNASGLSKYSILEFSCPY